MNKRIIAVVVACLLSASGFASDELPQPLSLQDALRIADQSHADIQLAKADVEMALANVYQAKQPYSPELNLKLEARRIDPADFSAYQERNDSRGTIQFRQRLYDFGQSSSALEASEYGLSAKQALLFDQRQQHHLNVMVRFFDVILADIKEQRENEAMAIAFIRYDKLNERNLLGMVSKPKVLEAQAAYEKIRIALAETGVQVRASRLALALSLNKPDQLPADLDEPDFDDGLLKKKWDVDELTKQALENSPQLKAAKLAMLEAQKKLNSAESSWKPVIYAEAKAGGYERETGATNPWEVGLVLEMPILDGGKRKTSVAKNNASYIRQQALLQKTEMQIRQQVMDLWQAYQTYVASVKALDVEDEYQEAMMERSRALYEQEVNTDFGDSMVRLSDFEYRKAQARFALMLTNAKIKAIQGQLLAGE